MMKRTIINKIGFILILVTLGIGNAKAGWPELGTKSYQDITIVYQTEEEPSDIGGFHEVIYANDKESKYFMIQKTKNAEENLDGYLRWYEVEDLNDLKDAGKQTVPTGFSKEGDKIHTFKNGVAWLRQGSESSDKDINEIDYTVLFNGKKELYLVCEASANANMTAGQREDEWIAPMVSYRQVYIIRQATNRLKESIGDLWNNNLPITDMPTLENHFLQSYEIHTPISRLNAAGNSEGNMNTFRLPEKLSNYYIPEGDNLTAASSVRWRVYNSEGTYIDQTTTENNILPNKKLYTGNEYSKQQTYYITSEVSSNNNTWYPVTLLKVFLEPYLEALTDKDLKNRRTNPNYQHRLDDFLEGNQYEQLEAIVFEEENDILTEENIEEYLEQNPTKNYSEAPMSNVDSYYAFANPGDYALRRLNRMNVGRGEYALYRTLNYPDISRDKIEPLGSYKDYFGHYGYNKKVVDRLWEREDGKKSGFFMYVDATDEPGVITKMNISGLCPHTSLIVSAWVCDLAHSNASDVAHADVGFTFKRVDKVDGEDTEVILSKYYSGSIVTKPAHNDSINNQALWQQIFFQFSFPDGTYEDQYILEIANNTPHSNGADYAIDDIKVYKSSPAITAQRKDACSVSTLVVSSDYTTLQQNMAWDLDPNVIDEVELNNPTYRKYRYGLMGENPYAPLEEVLHSNIGNVYFSFTEIKENEDAGDWVVVNKDLEEDEEMAELGLQYTIRVAVQSDMNKNPNNMIPVTADAALKSEITMNVRAMNDFLADVDRGIWVEDSGHQDHITKLQETIQKLCNRVETTDPNNKAKEPLKIESVYVDQILESPDLYKEYEAAVKDLYLCLQIPRIRCPWRSEDNLTLFLSTIDVDNTDLRFANEKYTDNEGEHTATGKYYVVLFSARDIANAENKEDAVDLNSQCTLKREIFVVPATTIKIDTDMGTSGVTCLGEIHTVNAKLLVADVDIYGNVLSTDMKDFDATFEDEGYAYTFDWFLGPAEEALELAKKEGYPSLQALLYAFRSTAKDEIKKECKPFTVEDVEQSGLSDEAKKVLIGLLNESRLTSGKTVSFRWVQKVVAMPYAYGGDLDTDNSKLFCTESQELTLEASPDVPELNVGFPDVDYPDDVPLNTIPLRLGLANIREGVTLEIPIQKGVIFGTEREDDGKALEDDGKALKDIKDKKTIYLEISGSKYETVATLNSLLAVKEGKDNKLFLTFNLNDEMVDTYFKEGEVYTLYIPFGEYADEDTETPIENSCLGYATLKIKIVPEYLTWKGDADDAWYNDNNWEQSTEKELYMGSQSEKDANGDDDITNAFSPLYFTKITIDPDKTGNSGDLVLNEVQLSNNVLTVDAGKATENIQYDMAVNTDEDGTLKVDKYYTNKVSEIYFKPNATLMNQYLLTYDTARVEFEMEQSIPYWMSSPLKTVYAGDMYAPTAGKQNTPAFDYITYKEGENSRWEPAFYQKAWDKAIAYATKEDGLESVSVNAVKNNWSIEYNDVWVPYTLGTGFYARVEGQDALVRLPKADLDYGYEAKPTTRAGLSTKPTTREGAGRIAGSEDITVTLTPDVDGDGNHFLVGNPYMTYLNMQKFFDANANNLNPKYWTIEDGTSKAVVGTPDVPWTGNETEDGTDDIQKISGFIPPMTAFFVERAGGYTEPTTKAEDASSINIVFKTDMMASKPAETARTKSVTASAPILTLTAERDGKKGRSVISLRDKADNSYKADEDAVVLLDSELDVPVAYSVAGNRAAQVNAVKRIDNIPVGVYNDTKEEVTLTIEGISQLAEPLYLYDAHTRKSTLLEGDSYTLTVSGASHGRYYLRSSAANGIGDNAIAVYSVENGKVIISGTEGIRNVKVYSLNGGMVKNYMNLNTVQYVFHLPAGIYVVHVDGGDNTSKVEKVIVR
ncbi:T9SS type A sorting domain-containing protein [Parabacteroides acidifaciens]|uniref:T9SS C-terminal target domain-containing protein n=1 Tax=Parabacteroides acidifaciens TaxID=2290935 RepID=A0A3D8HIK4_9BACT|nr:T9SS type A sorting domain-containing protein [Parabacteroides acidifaciens]MBC8600718.1 T9SS type A sorting domain-containing protein [Parabacteroides acidifaciens]RDU50713.1 T9SS C-terminal target domain-containing protein [Parabacteroides acidifaciens]